MTEHRRLFTKQILLLLVALSTCNTAHAQRQFVRAVDAFTKQHCIVCHDRRQEKGDFRIDTLSRDLTDPAVAVAWQDALDLVTLGEMPPEEQPRPSKEELQSFMRAVQDELRRVAEISRSKDTLRLRRLSHTALENSVRDLLGTHLSITPGLPPDPEVAGFDNMASTLGQSGEFMDVLQRNARRIANETIVEGRDPRVDLKLQLHEIQPGREVIREGDRYVTWSCRNRSVVSWPKKFVAPRTGVYRIAFEGYQTDNRYELDQQVKIYNWIKSKNANNFRLKLLERRLPEERTRNVAIMAMEAPITDSYDGTTGGRMVGLVEMKPTMSWYEVDCELEEGESFFIHAADCQQLQDPPLIKFQGKEILAGELMHLRSIKIKGPLVESWPPPLQQRLLSKEGKISRQELQTFLSRAFRDEVDKDVTYLYFKALVDAVKAGQSPEQALRQLVEAVLCSPRFLYNREPTDEHRDWPLASRLSYFLWNTMPDEELMQLAAEGKLARRDVLKQQIERMIADEKSEGFILDFAGQWLGLRKVGAMPPDPKLYPDYDLALEKAMRTESEALFREVLRENLPVTDFLSPDYAMLNERLARHYGIDGVEGSEFRRVSLPSSSPRGGLLGHASMLTITSNGTRTSPVVRGVWILENLLDSPPSPPPADVEPIEPDVRGAKTIRQMLAKHRDIETCNECHRRIDPWGFGLENFNAIGAWRDTYGRKQKPIDASGKIYNGPQFNGMLEMKDILLSQEDRFTHALTAKLLAHAVGHPTTVKERMAIDKIVKRHKRKRGGFADLIAEICVSEAFRGN